MATKPVTYPNIWDSSGIYTTGPFIGAVSIVDPGVGVAGEGHRPGSLYPTAAEHENYQQFQLTTWVTTWLALGSSAGAADAHILETDSVGRFGAVGATFVDAVDETVLDITAANTLVPAVFVTSAATSYQANMGRALRYTNNLFLALALVDLTAYAIWGRGSLPWLDPVFIGLSALLFSGEGWIYIHTDETDPTRWSARLSVLLWAVMLLGSIAAYRFPPPP